MNKLFPVVIVDDFLENPDKIRDIALNTQYLHNDGSYPGKRTLPLHEINQELQNYLANKFFSVFYDFFSPINWVIKITFQLIEPYDESKESAFNKGWIHTDSDNVLAGVLYLTPNPDLEMGTSIYMPKKEIKESGLKGIQLKKHELYRYGLKQNDYENEINKFNNNFVETVNVKNIYNRLIAFDCNCWHAAQNFKSENEPRLTALFFVSLLNSASPAPLERIRKITL
jgi:hypothetical protein